MEKYEDVVIRVCLILYISKNSASSPKKCASDRFHNQSQLLDPRNRDKAIKIPSQIYFYVTISIPNANRYILIRISSKSGHNDILSFPDEHKKILRSLFSFARVV